MSAAGSQPALRARTIPFGVLLLCGLFTLGTSPGVRAASRSKVAKTTQAAYSKARKKTSKRVSARAKALALAEARAKAEAEAIAAGRAAVFVFDGDEAEPLRWEVIRLLQANGMRVQTDLRPTDTAVQFRDMAAALNLAIYVHGRIKDTPRGRAVATVTVRSGVTGRKIASASFDGTRRELVSLVEQGLWDRVKSPLGRACVEARKPGRRHSAPMRIEAGTPVEDTPARSDGT